jgi:hypothetical protein
VDIIGNIIERLTVSKASQERLHARELIERIEELGQGRVVLSTGEARELRIYLADRLGRELADTPLPDSYNNVEIVVDPKK